MSHEGELVFHGPGRAEREQRTRGRPFTGPPQSHSPVLYTFAPSRPDSCCKTGSHKDTAKITFRFSCHRICYVSITCYQTGTAFVSDTKGPKKVGSLILEGISQSRDIRPRETIIERPDIAPSPTSEDIRSSHT